jgi:hypothetical protein
MFVASQPCYAAETAPVGLSPGGRHSRAMFRWCRSLLGPLSPECRDENFAGRGAELPSGKALAVFGSLMS